MGKRRVPANFPSFLGCYVPEWMHDDLRILALERDTCVSAIVRDAIAEHLERSAEPERTTDP